MLSVIGMIESENWRWAKNYNDDEHCSHSSRCGSWLSEDVGMEAELDIKRDNDRLDKKDLKE